MNPDDFKKNWQAQTSRTRLTIDADLLVKEVRRNQQAFTVSVFWRDVREIGVSLLMLPVCVYLATRSPSSWPWYLMLLVLLWIAGFMLADRLRHKQCVPAPCEPLRQHVESSLFQVEHQIWLLRNVLWWYLLPPGFVFLLMYGESLWSMRAGGWWMALGTTLCFALTFLTLVGVYWLNRYAVRAGLEPRRRELQDLLASLKDPTDSGPPAPAPGPKGA